MSCKTIEELLASHRDALSETLSEDSELRSHVESCGACSEESKLQEEIVGALAPLREVRPLRPFSLSRIHEPRSRSWEKIAMAASLLFCLGLVWVIASPFPERESAVLATRLIQDGDEKRIVELVAKLGSVAIEERESAELELLRLGEKIVPHLKREIRDGMDPEVRSRIERILRVLPFGEFLGAEGAGAFVSATSGLEKVDVLLKLRERLEKAELSETAGLLLADEILGAFPWRERYDDSVHQRDLFALKKIADQKLRPLGWLYVRLLGHAHPYVRLHAVGGLRDLGATEHVARVASLVEDADERVRREAAGALAEFGAADYADRIVKLLADNDPGIRRSTLLNLEKLLGLKARLEIEGRLGDSDRRVRSEAAVVLERMGAKDSIEALRKAAEAEKHERTRGILESAIRDLEEMQGVRKPVESRTKWQGPKSEIREPSYFLIRSMEEWAALWARHAPGSKAPEVDFRESMVVAIFHGDNSNSGGIALVSTTEDDARIVVRFRGMWYQTMGGGHSVTDFGIFVIPRSSKSVVLQESMPYMIGDPTLWKERARFQSP